MLRSQPDRAAIFAWLRGAAIHEAYRLSRIHGTPHLEADEVLSQLVAGEVVDSPVKPEMARAADEVRRLRDDEHLTWKEIAERMGRSEAGVIWLHRRRAVRGPSSSATRSAISWYVRLCRSCSGISRTTRSGRSCPRARSISSSVESSSSDDSY